MPSELSDEKSMEASRRICLLKLNTSGVIPNLRLLDPDVSPDDRELLA